MVSLTINGSSGALQILDGKRDIRSNVENTITSFHISGYSGAYPSLIINYPVQERGYVYSSTDGSLTAINYGTESSSGSAGSLGGLANSLAVAQDDTRIFAAVEQAGELTVIDNSSGRSYALNLPNVYQVAMNSGNTIALAMVRNSNALYRVVKLIPNTVYNTATNAVNPLFPPGAVDCEPYVLPAYCVVPVPTTANALNEPLGAYFSLDGSTVYVINCGTECNGPNPATLPGSTASITPFPVGALNDDVVPSTSSPSPVVNSPSINIPGGVTEMISDGTNLYLAGQQLQTNGLFAGELTVVPLSTLTPAAPIAISDGNHTKMLFGDAGNHTLWIGSQHCANGNRAYIAAQELSSKGYTDQSGNYNCLTQVTLGATPAVQIIPQVVQSTNSAVTPVPVPYPNQDLDSYYYGSLTGLCLVEGFGKMYTAYGGQVHAFNDAAGSEIDNSLITVQGTALDVAYMDASTNTTN
jgi:rhodanese-related sulfurtransferase